MESFWCETVKRSDCDRPVVVRNGVILQSSSGINILAHVVPLVEFKSKKYNNIVHPLKNCCYSILMQERRDSRVEPLIIYAELCCSRESLFIHRFLFITDPINIHVFLLLIFQILIVVVLLVMRILETERRKVVLAEVTL